MFYVLGQNFKYFLKMLPRFLSFVFVIQVKKFFPEHDIVVWLFKMLIAFFILWNWFNKMKKQSKWKFFKPSFMCMGLYCIIMIAVIMEKGEIGGSIIFLDGMAVIAGMILGYKALNDSWAVITKYQPQLKMNIDIHSPDDYFEVFSQAENCEKELSKLKKEAPSAVVEAIMQRRAGQFIPFFHVEILYLALLMLCGTPWIR